MKKILGVMGDPIAHSLSPQMHAAAFKDCGIDAVYSPLHITPEELNEAVNELKILGFHGFNVTIPHKTAIMPLLDEIDPLAKSIGAVNTVVREGNKFVGYNTDGIGFIDSLKAVKDVTPSNEKVLIIGAGGAAKAIYYSLASENVPVIDIYNRTSKSAEELKEHCPFDCQSAILTKEEAERQLSNYTLIVQTTSVGMSPNINETPLSMQHVATDALVVDIIYNPFETKFLQEAKKNGAQVLNGLGMFVHQGARAFLKWTDQQANTKIMEIEVLKQLGGTTC